MAFLPTSIEAQCPDCGKQFVIRGRWDVKNYYPPSGSAPNTKMLSAIFTPKETVAHTCTPSS